MDFFFFKLSCNPEISVFWHLHEVTQTTDKNSAPLIFPFSMGLYFDLYCLIKSSFIFLNIPYIPYVKFTIVSRNVFSLLCVILIWDLGIYVQYHKWSIVTALYLVHFVNVMRQPFPISKQLWQKKFSEPSCPEPGKTLRRLKIKLVL